MPTNYFAAGEAIATQIDSTVSDFAYVGPLNAEQDVFTQGARLPACFIRLAANSPPDRPNADLQWTQDWDIIIVCRNPADGRGGWRSFNEAGALLYSVAETALTDFRPATGFSRLEFVDSPFETVNRPGGYLATFLRVRTKFDSGIDDE